MIYSFLQTSEYWVCDSMYKFTYAGGEDRLERRLVAMQLYLYSPSYTYLDPSFILH